MTRKQDRKAKAAKPSSAGATNANNTKLGSRDATKISDKVDKGKGKGKATLGSAKNGAPKAAATVEPANEELDEAALLLREIKSLGGNDEDYAFLKDVDTDDEAIENETVEDKKLAKELKSFMATLGDLGKAYADGEDDDEEQVASEDEEAGDLEESADEVSLDEDEELSEAEEQRDTVKPVEAPKSVPATQAVAKPAPVSRSGMLVDPNPLWYETELPDLPSVSSDAPQPSLKTIEQLQARGAQLLTELSETFSGSLQSSGKADKLAMSSTLSTSDRTFISTILQSGTSSDKLSALILLSSSSPLHTTTYLSQLLALTKKKSRDEAVRAIRAIVDWLKGGAAGSGTAGLPDRKLRWFAEQPGLTNIANAKENEGMKKSGKRAGDEHLLVWAFEDWLKKWYFDLLKSIEGLSHDPLPFVRTQMTGFLAALLSSKPEQEQNLLRLLVDKLGDSDRTVSSRTSYHLLQLLQNHPMMKNIVVREAAALVLRPAQSAPPTSNGKRGAPTASSAQPSVAAGLRSSDHSRYYGIITLNQIMLTRTEQDKLVANRLIEVYFDIFNDLLGSYDDAEDEGPKESELKDRKQRRDDKKNGGNKRKREEEKLKAMPRKERRKLEQNQQALEAESKIMAAVLTGVNRAFPYSDIEGDVLHKRVDTLFRIIHTGTFNVGIQAMTLIFQVSSKQSAVSDRFYRVLYDSLVDPRLANCSKQAMYLNLLFKAMKADTSAKRVAAFVKRLTQVLGTHQPPFVCGALYLLGELFSLTPGLRSMLTDPEDADDDVEEFKDAPDSAGEEEAGSDGIATAKAAAMLKGEFSTKYDGRKREPQYANAQNSCLWEIMPLIYHFHPSVALHASQLLASSPITTTPDLELHTLSHFLDRFVYRNAKKALGGKESLMKPGAKGLDRSGMVLMRKGAGAMTDNRVNAEDFLKKKEGDVPADQMFFHRFFTQKQENEQTKDAKSEKRKRRGDADADDDDIDLDGSDLEGSADEAEDADAPEGEGSELDEDEIWKAMQKSMPSAGGDDGEADDGGDPDLEEDSDVGVEEFAYSDSDVGVDEEVAGPDEEEEAAEPQSFFPNEDDDELDGFGEEDDDVLGSDEDIVLEEGIELPKTKGGKDGDSRRAKKRKLKHLPAFASADDWKDLIDAGDSDA